MIADVLSFSAASARLTGRSGKLALTDPGDVFDPAGLMFDADALLVVDMEIGVPALSLLLPAPADPRDVFAARGLGLKACVPLTEDVETGVPVWSRLLPALPVELPQVSILSFFSFFSRVIFAGLELVFVADVVVLLGSTPVETTLPLPFAIVTGRFRLSSSPLGAARG